jgi:hypothetical protein
MKTCDGKQGALGEGVGKPVPQVEARGGEEHEGANVRRPAARKDGRARERHSSISKYTSGVCRYVAWPTSRNPAAR